VWQICRLLLKDYAIKLVVGTPCIPPIYPPSIWSPSLNVCGLNALQHPIALCVWLALVCTFVTRLRFRSGRFVSNATTQASWPLTPGPVEQSHPLSTFCPSQALCGCAIMRCNKFYVVRVLPPWRPRKTPKTPKTPQEATTMSATLVRPPNFQQVSWIE